MEVQTNIPLKKFSTMQLGGPARFMTTITTAEELKTVVERARAQSLPFFVLGGGSNVIISDQGFNGLVILNRIPGFTVLADTPAEVTLQIGAGENWDSVVAHTVQMGLTGIEALSAIPGTAGATPVQNVGAYGQEIADTLVELEAYDTERNGFVRLTNADCGFSYRHSIFKDPTARHHIITSITLKLRRGNPTPPFYDSLQAYLDTHNARYYTPQVIRDAVIAIRAEKLPDPSVYPNAGSFFRNPVIETWQYEALLKDYPDMPSYPMDERHVKIPAGWLIDQVGLKGYESHGIKVYDKNALVLINISAQSTADLQAAKEEIRGQVRDTFRIFLEQEPEEL